MAVRPAAVERAAAGRRAAAVLVAGGRGDELGRGAGDGEGDGRLHAAGRGHQRTRATGPSAPRRCWRRCSRGQPHRSPDRRGAALDAAPGPRAGPREALSTPSRRSPPTCWPGSSRPTRASDRRSSPRPPVSSPPTTPTRSGQRAAHPNFDPARFAASADTIYITAPEHRQALCAPLIVGLLEQVRHAVYERAASEAAEGPAMLWALDEVANIAPIHDLPALISQAGGPGAAGDGRPAGPEPGAQPLGDRGRPRGS